MGESKPAHRRGAAVDKTIVGATLAELFDKGPEELTIAGVAQRAGVHISSIYRRWQTREELMVGALLSRSAIEVPLPDTGNFRTDLIQFLRGLAVFLQSPNGLKFLKIAVMPVNNSRVAKSRAEFMHARLSVISGIVDRAAARGEVSHNIDRKLVFEPLIAPLYMRILITQEPLDETFLTGLVDVVLYGIKVQ
ncbi:MAG: TetR/AcrR family transcriptional regulator [Mycobacteriaceae bacterium]